MLRRKKARGFRAANSPDLALAKTGLNVRALQRQDDQERATWIQWLRGVVLLRDRRCRACGGPAEHMHEIRFRSELRGRPWREIFTLSNCLMLCADCHDRAHHKTGKAVGGWFWRLLGKDGAEPDANKVDGVVFERVDA